MLDVKIETGTKLNVAKIINFDDLIHVYSPFLIGDVLPKFGAVDRFMSCDISQCNGVLSLHCHVNTYIRLFLTNHYEWTQYNRYILNDGDQ